MIGGSRMHHGIWVWLMMQCYGILHIDRLTFCDFFSTFLSDTRLVEKNGDNRGVNFDACLKMLTFAFYVYRILLTPNP
jgi:hypothetical protein